MSAPPERVSDLLTNDGGMVMPRGYPLSEAVKDGIWELRAKGLSDHEIGRRLGLRRGIVSNHLRWIGRMLAVSPVGCNGWGLCGDEGRGAVRVVANGAAAHTGVAVAPDDAPVASRKERNRSLDRASHRRHRERRVRTVATFSNDVSARAPGLSHRHQADIGDRQCQPEGS
jgi:hypothetical protein